MAKSIRSKRNKRLRSIKRATWLKAKEEQNLRTTRSKLAELTGSIAKPEEGEDMIKDLTGYAKAMADSKQTTKGNQVHYHPDSVHNDADGAALLAAAAAGDAAASGSK